MAMIEGFRVQNYGVLKDITLGRLWNQQKVKPLTPLVAVIGKNGVGKSTLFDAFGFVADCLSVGVEEACDIRQRGGFDRLVSNGTSGPIQFTIYFRESPKDRPITYEVSIAKDKDDRPYVESERLRQRRKGQGRGWPFSFLNLENGKGAAWKGESYDLSSASSSSVSSSSSEESKDKVDVELTDPRRLGIATLGTLVEHPRIALFRDFIENWYLSYFTPDAARSLPLAGPQKHLDTRHASKAF